MIHTLRSYCIFPVCLKWDLGPFGMWGWTQAEILHMEHVSKRPMDISVFSMHLTSIVLENWPREGVLETSACIWMLAFGCRRHMEADAGIQMYTHALAYIITYIGYFIYEMLILLLFNKSVFYQGAVALIAYKNKYVYNTI